MGKKEKIFFIPSSLSNIGSIRLFESFLTNCHTLGLLFCKFEARSVTMTSLFNSSTAFSLPEVRPRIILLTVFCRTRIAGFCLSFSALYTSLAFSSFGSPQVFSSFVGFSFGCKLNCLAALKVKTMSRWPSIYPCPTPRFM